MMIMGWGIGGLRDVGYITEDKPFRQIACQLRFATELIEKPIDYGCTVQYQAMDG